MSADTVFAFLGEFGYELLNWQAVVRKYCRRSGRGTVVACSRTGLEPFYRGADVFVEISDLPAFRSSTAGGYTVLDSTAIPTIHGEIRDRVFSTVPNLDREAVRFVFSDRAEQIDGLQFGAGGIYGDLTLDNNEFVRIEADQSVRSELESELGFGLAEPFVLCQTARREIVVRSPDLLPEAALVELLSSRTRVVLLDFQTARHRDSHSKFARHPGCVTIAAGDFRRQSCLIHHADACVFFTEGDFRSHIYLPPFLGRDVHAVAPRSVYSIRGAGGALTAPVEFWNTFVFRFGGQIHPYASEPILNHATSRQRFADRVLG